MTQDFLSLMGFGDPRLDDLVLELPNDLAAIESAVEYVVSALNGHADPRKLSLNLRVGLTEALSNAMLYGNRQDPAKRVRVEIMRAVSSITVRVTDEGPGFDPACVPDPTLPRNRRRPCGRGVFLMRQLMDEVHYNEQGNSVTLILRSGSGGLGGAPA
ncbi:MAG: ATP-binding protein [Gemmatimonadota bacterium]